MEMVIDLLEVKRMELGLDQTEFAKLLGINGKGCGGWYSRVASNAKPFPPNWAEVVAKLLGKTPEEIRTMIQTEKKLRKGDALKILMSEPSASDLRYLAGVIDRDGPLTFQVLIQRLASRPR
jgi:hypothetical protein